MECVKPLTIVKDGVSYVVSCGRCISCRLNFSNSWATRIVSESKMCKYSSFVTLTYEDKNLPYSEKGVPTLRKRDCQLFFKRSRKEVSFRYYLGAEYGDIFHRPHYHFCAFSNDPKILVSSFWYKFWQNGFVYVGSLTRDSANYVAKYCVKKLKGLKAEFYKEQGIEPEFALMSRRPGIGYDYIMKFKDLVKRNGFVVVDGKKQSIPRYFGSKIFTDEEKAENFSRFTAQRVCDCLDDVACGKGFDYKQQELKQLENNIKSKFDLKKIKK